MSQTTDREHDAGRPPAAPSHQPTKESNVSNPTNVFDHTGWRQVDGQNVYLHRGGALGPSGPVAGIGTELDGSLDRFAPPDPPERDELQEALRASLALIAPSPRPTAGGSAT